MINLQPVSSTLEDKSRKVPRLTKTEALSPGIDAKPADTLENWNKAFLPLLAQDDGWSIERLLQEYLSPHTQPNALSGERQENRTDMQPEDGKVEGVSITRDQMTNDLSANQLTQEHRTVKPEKTTPGDHEQENEEVTHEHSDDQNTMDPKSAAQDDTEEDEWSIEQMLRDYKHVDMTETTQTHSSKAHQPAQQQNRLQAIVESEPMESPETQNEPSQPDNEPNNTFNDYDDLPRVVGEGKVEQHSVVVVHREKANHHGIAVKIEDHEPAPEVQKRSAVPEPISAPSPVYKTTTIPLVPDSQYERLKSTTSLPSVPSAYPIEEQDRSKSPEPITYTLATETTTSYESLPVTSSYLASFAEECDELFSNVAQPEIATNDSSNKPLPPPPQKQRRINGRFSDFISRSPATDSVDTAPLPPTKAEVIPEKVDKVDKVGLRRFVSRLSGSLRVKQSPPARWSTGSLRASVSSSDGRPSISSDIPKKKVPLESVRSI